MKSSDVELSIELPFVVKPRARLVGGGVVRLGVDIEYQRVGGNGVGIDIRVWNR